MKYSSEALQPEGRWVRLKVRPPSMASVGNTISRCMGGVKERSKHLILAMSLSIFSSELSWIRHYSSVFSNSQFHSHELAKFALQFTFLFFFLQSITSFGKDFCATPDNCLLCKEPPLFILHLALRVSFDKSLVSCTEQSNTANPPEATYHSVSLFSFSPSLFYRLNGPNSFASFMYKSYSLLLNLFDAVTHLQFSIFLYGGTDILSITPPKLTQTSFSECFWSHQADHTCSRKALAHQSYKLRNSQH